jgi:hypothetical protein
MTVPGSTAGDGGSWPTSPMEARLLLRRQREQVLQYAEMPEMLADDQAGAVRSGVEASGRGPLPALPERLQRLVDDYQRDHPAVRLVPRTYVGVDEGGSTVVGAADVPAEDQLVSLGITETVLDADAVRVRSHLLLAAAIPSTSD